MARRIFISRGSLISVRTHDDENASTPARPSHPSPQGAGAAGGPHNQVERRGAAFEPAAT